MMKLFFKMVGSFALVASVTGCGGTPNPPPKPAVNVAAGEKHEDHHGAGPHGGTLADWGGGAYHVEFTVDHDKQESAVYVLGSDEKTPVPIKAAKIQLSINDPQIQVELMAQPLAGESNGLSSRFVGKHESLGKVQEFAGTISGEVDGTPYAGDFKEEAAGHGHKH